MDYLCRILWSHLVFPFHHNVLEPDNSIWKTDHGVTCGVFFIPPSITFIVLLNSELRDIFHKGWERAQFLEGTPQEAMEALNLPDEYDQIEASWQAIMLL